MIRAPYCSEHTYELSAPLHRNYGPEGRDKFYDSRRWRALARYVRRRDKVCRVCGRLGNKMDVDHIIPRRVLPSLAYTASNLQLLCASCHAAKRKHEGV